MMYVCGCFVATACFWQEGNVSEVEVEVVRSPSQTGVYVFEGYVPCLVVLWYAESCVGQSVG